MPLSGRALTPCAEPSILKSRLEADDGTRVFRGVRRPALEREATRIEPAARLRWDRSGRPSRDRHSPKIRVSLMIRISPAIVILLMTCILVGAPVSGAAAEEDFAACLAGLRAEAPAQGVNAASFTNYANDLTPNDAPAFLGAQPEFNLPIWDYLGGLVDDQRVQDGLVYLRENAAAFARIERRFGVDRRVIAALWGVESDYGRRFGKRPVLQSLVSLACHDSPRRGYFRTEFFAALRIVQGGDVRPDHFYGSWAGAFGQTQFMPTTFFRSAVSMDGGRRDIVDSAPNALASTANYLRQHGWTPGLRWGFEVRLPPSYAGPSGRFAKRRMTVWTAAGLRKFDGSSLGVGIAGLYLPEGDKGPAFLTTSNFDVLTSYNSSESYALALGLLSDRLAGAPPLAIEWLNGERGLSRAERKETQTILARRGYDVGDADGVLGAKSRGVIAGLEPSLGMAPDGWASERLLLKLRGSP